MLYFKDFIQTAFENGDYASDDVIAFVLPLFKEVLSFHEEGKVGPFTREEALFLTCNCLDIDENYAALPKNEMEKVKALFKKERADHFEVVGSIKIDTDVDSGSSQVEDLHIHLNRNEPLHHPAYLPGYSCFEMVVGHHDDLSDIFCLGLVLGSMALGLDLYDEQDLKLFVHHRTNPAYYNQRIHPTISALITEMTQLDRRKRTQDLYDVIQRLENYRDFDPEKQIDLSKVAGWKVKEISSQGQFILGKLRNRLFDTSRRNRLLYYKPNMRFVNLTVSSVPMVLHYQSIRPELLFTWNTEISGKVKDMKEIVLNKYLRFDDHQYLASSLDKIRVEAQHDIQEYGFSQLKLVIAFLNWHNLKEDIQERIQSPLLLIPVELKKNKKLKEDHYVMKVLANEAEINPIVANTLRELYGIRLPEYIDLDDTTLESFFEKLKQQIDHANQGVTLKYIDKPRIKLIHSVARQTVSNYRKRLKKGGKGLESYKNIGYSYAQEHYKPLGLEIFRQQIEPRASMLEFLVDEDVKISSHNLTGSKERELFQLVESESNPYSWDFDVCNIVLGNFNYKKMSLVRDYNQVIDNTIHHQVFEHLFSDQPKKFSEDRYDLNNPAGWYHVITADPTQTRAVMQGRTGESYIIQGPPGTGKSQTITNLIADFIAQGKSVLFVCEKRAALDVVYHRLKQQGLDELCCYIHDSQGDKREFIKNLKVTYEDFTKTKLDPEKIESEREVLVQKMTRHLQWLEQFHKTGAGTLEHAGIEGRKLIERLIELKQHLVNLPASQEELLPHYREWLEFGETIRELSKRLEDSGAEAVFSEHPFSLVREEVFLSGVPGNFLSQSVQKAEGLLQNILSVYKDHGITGEDWEGFAQLRNLIEDAVLLYPFAEKGNMRLLETTSSQAKEFEASYRSYKDLQKQAGDAEQQNGGWNTKFSEQDVLTALPIVLENEKSFFSFFNGSWRKLKKQLNACYDFSRHQVRPAYSTVLEGLKKEYELQKEVNQLKQGLEQRYQLINLDQAYYGMERIRAKKGDKEIDFLLQNSSSDELVRTLYRLNGPLRELDALLKQLIYDHDYKTVSAILDELESVHANLEGLGDLLPVLKDFTHLSPALKRAVRNLSVTSSALEAVIAHKTLKNLYQYNREFEVAGGASIENAVAQISHCYQQLLKLNALCIRARVRSVFRRHMELSNTALSQLTGEQKSFKKAYTEGRKILENEFSKSMRYKSIRELAAKESGIVLKDLKPVWLMSPLSVSDSLPVDGSTFDVVIFDEASQITLEEGIPSLYRAPQTIIVGDEKQMPPTNFFSAKAEDPDDLEKHSEEDQDLLNNDADSLLVQGSRKLSSVMLGWHYRSRYETLISYSNHAFYEAGLLTIPDRIIHHEEKNEILVSSVEDAEAHADALFDRSISFHYHSNSLYEKRANLAEARYIAHLVRVLLKRKVEDSIGIVAFSQEQQHTIEDALTVLATEDAEFEQLLEEACQRTEEDQFVGLFVKNLENVQGDERDIIIMSVCYGFDSRKKMIMNFGPINRKGGEKRLNVIFSRAKKHMAVISSIRHFNITNEYNEGASYFKRFLHYAEQVSCGNMDTARVILDNLVVKRDKIKENGKESVVLRQLKEALEKEGLEVAEAVGQSGFKCTIAVKLNKDDKAYTLGVLLDDEQHYLNENIAEQYYQRPGILKAFGWRTISVFAKDWFHNPSKVVVDIKKRLCESPASEGEEPETELPFFESFEAPMVENTVPALAGTGNAYDHLSYKRYTCVEGTSHKFWEAAVDGVKLVVRFGRIGTRGQTSIKTFLSIEKAEEYRSKLIEEKLSKGYKEQAN